MDLIGGVVVDITVDVVYFLEQGKHVDIVGVVVDQFVVVVVIQVGALEIIPRLLTISALASRHQKCTRIDELEIVN